MPQVLQLPRDLFAREDVENEWWYYHGHLESGDRQFGFHLAFFRRRTELVRLGRFLQLGRANHHTRFAHFALADIERRQFHYGQQRSHNGQAGAASDRYDVWSGNWFARQDAGAHRLRAKIRDIEMDLRLTPRKPAIGHGLNGFYPKVDGHSSVYFSYPRLDATGSLLVANEVFHVSGQAWMDREFGHFRLNEVLNGWDWFGIQLDDDRELLIYRLRSHTHDQTNHSMAVLIDRDHSVKRLEADQFELAPLAAWRSPRTGNVYPSAWRARIPSLHAELTIEPFMHCHELDTRGSTSVIYWEGPGRVHGTLSGREARGRCYIELVGYESDPERLGLFDFDNNQLSLAGWIANEFRLRWFGRGVKVQDHPQVVVGHPHAVASSKDVPA